MKPDRSFARAWLLPTCTALLAAGAALPARAQGMGPAPVVVAEAVQREVAEERSFLGTVMPLRTATVGSQVDGAVLEYLAREGEFVRRGQVLARLRTQTVEIQIAAARAELELRKRESEELEHGSRTQEVEMARARLAKAQSALDYAKTNLERVQRLFEPHTVSEGEVDVARTAAEKAAQEMEEAKSSLAMAEEGPRKEKIAQAQARIAIQLEAIRLLEDVLEKHTIAAPFDGFILAEHTEVGEWIAKGGPVARIADLSEVEVEAPVLEDCMRRLAAGAPARVELSALPGEIFAGKISVLLPQADVRSRTFPVKIRIPNPLVDGGVRLKAGMSARVTLAVGEKTSALLVPKDALVMGGPTPMVYRVEPNPQDPKRGTVAPVPVQAGISSGGWIQVTGALTPGAQVVVQGNERLRPGQEIVITQVVAPDAK